MRLNDNQQTALREAAKTLGFAPTLDVVRNLDSNRKVDVKRFLTQLLQERGLSDDDVNDFGRDVDDLIGIIGF